MQARHGDLLIEPHDGDVPDDAEERPERVLAYGEATGHAHRIDKGEVFEADNGLVYMEIPEAGAELTHEEHDTIEIPGGTYEVQRQREYDPTVQEPNTNARRVLD